PGKTPTIIYNPFTGDPATGAGRIPFANNEIPLSMINKVSAKILSVIPQPNFVNASNPYAQNYFVNSPFFRNTDQFDVKVDHNQTDADRLTVRYSYSRPVLLAIPRPHLRLHAKEPEFHMDSGTRFHRACGSKFAGDDPDEPLRRYRGAVTQSAGTGRMVAAPCAGPILTDGMEIG